ncbi:acyl-CoA synthetase [Natronomonas pharaonis DSM 2160]|uniref:Acyl-CoA synthetase n=1 Tax=Natronomonas pharaonis (strain ATCC 35678 / DSM 2160 / CIP 103997 / JCM 8858 / NBRC 14720 / NCIMB 2260 / Gabara) TaxID=348780 RepID=A0A1U7EYA9_NATPD|nr:AMP-binding protein [Natronomonas pharaonis]CAI50219.1 acyl-CoA synthetase [Natronomonas pharaonis DSM 2160]
MSLPRDSVRTVGEALERRADRDGAAPFVQYKDARASYGEVNRMANAIAGRLQANGIGTGDTVCLFLYNSMEYIYLYFALAKLGAVVAPVDTRFTGETLATVLETADAEAVFVDTDTREQYEAVREDVSGLPTEYFVGPQQDGGPYRPFAPLLDGDETPPDVAVSEADTLSVTFVQRHATEQPKGIELPQYSYLNTGWEASQHLFDFSGKDRIFTTLPLYSIFAFHIGVVGSLVTDAAFAFEDPFDPDVFWSQVDRYDASVVLYLGRMLSVLYNQDDDADGADNAVETAIGHGFGFGTDEALIENFEERFDITVLEGYGVTQTATLATYNTADDRTVGSAGRPVSHAEVAVVDDNDWPVDAGEAGEIVIRPTRPNTMMQGYRGDPEATIEDCRNQWIHTGDIGYMDEDGYLHFVANEDNSIYRGRVAGRISSLEIESVIDAVPGVAESAVVGVEDVTGTEEIKAVVVPDADASLDPVDVYRHCRGSLPYVKVPRYVELRAELPRDPTGKVRKAPLRRTDPAATWDRDSGYEFSR